ncbi:uncharacterized protein LOC134820452 isoform X2 [Bolinopsis microptera]
MNEGIPVRTFKQSINSEGSEYEEDVPEIGMVPAFIMSINFIIGAGFFSMPYVFYHGGIMWGAMTLILVTLTLVITSNWTLETCSRAQALDTVIRESDIPDLNFHDVSIVGRRNNTFGSVNSRTRLLKPKYEITAARKFEFTELMEVFFGKPGRIITASLIIVYLLVTLCAYATIFASTWSLVIPYNTSIHSLGLCNLSDYEGLLPGGDCLNSYRFSVLIFACIVIPISAMDVSTMKPFQIALSFIMQFTIGVGIIHCIYGLATGNIADGEHQPHPTRFFAFDFTSFVNMVPIVVYSQVLHEGIPMIAQPARDKKNLHKLFAGALSFACTVYLTFSILTALRFREDVAATASLNWNVTRQPGNPMLIRMISYLIMLTPSVVVCSAYPLCVITMVANLGLLITGRDLSTDPKYKNKLKLVGCFISIIPISGALFISNLKTLSKYAGLIAFLLIGFIPIMLQVQSRRKCRRVFGRVDAWIEKSISASLSFREEDRMQLLDKYAKLRDVMTMTPYYSSWWSRTWVVAVVTVICTLLFILGIISAFSVAH